jgi:hypothetical protein
MKIRNKKTGEIREVSVNELNQYGLGGNMYKSGGEMIKRADGSYSKRGLWDNIRANAGSGKQPTKKMLSQERKIKSHYQDGGEEDVYWRTKQPMVNDPSMDAISKVLLQRNQDKNFMQRAAGFGNQNGIPTRYIDGQDPDSNNMSNLLIGFGDNYVSPTIIETFSNPLRNNSTMLRTAPGQLIYQPDQMEEYIKTPTVDVSDYFAAKGYKRAANDMYGMKYQEGGEEEVSNLKNINLNLPVYRKPEMNPLSFNKFLVNDRNQNLFIGGVNPRYQNENFSVGPYMVGVGNKYFQKFPADMGMSGTYHVNDNFDINMGVGQNNVNAGIKYKFKNGGDVPTIEGPSGYMNEDDVWIVDNETIKRQAKELGAKRVLTEGGSLIIFDDDWNIIAANDNPNAPYKEGGEKLPNDFNKFQEFNKTLPNNLRNDDFKYGDYSQYDLYGMWDAAGKPNSFDDVKDTENFPLQEDDTYHGFSVGNDGIWLKPKSHPSAWMEYMQGQLSTDPYFNNNHVIQKEDGRLQYVPNNYITKQSLEQKNETDIPQNINPKFMYSAPPSVFANGGGIPMYGPGGQTKPTASDSLAVMNSQIALNKFYDDEVKKGKLKKDNDKLKIDEDYLKFRLKNLNDKNLQFYRKTIAERQKSYNRGSGTYDDKYKSFFNLNPSDVSKLEYQGLGKTKSSDAYRQYYRDLITPMQNLAAPFALVDSRIKPRAEISYRPVGGGVISDYPGGSVSVFDYDPIAVKPAAMKTAADWAYMKKTYGTKPPAKNSKPPARQTINTTQGQITGTVRPNQIKGSQLTMMINPVRSKENLERMEMIPYTFNNPKVVPHGELIPVPQMQLKQQGTIPFYGPGNTIIGYTDDDRQFYPLQYSGAKNNQLNLLDKELLDNPEMLQKFVQSKDNYKFAKGGGIPERYRNMGFTSVGAKKQSTRPGKKWMVLAKKGDDYKVVHGGYKGMQDFKQHHSEQRKENFWNRMGGRNSSKATDPFSPLYWHKRFGTWEQGGQIPMAQDGVDVNKLNQKIPYVNYFPGATNNSNNYTKAAKYLARDVFKGAPLKANDIATAIEKFKVKTGYEYPLDLLLSQAQQETHFGKELKSKHNYFNVGNDDDGNVINFASPEESFLNYMDLVYNDYLQKGKKDYHDLLVDNGYVNYAKKRYAKDPLYEKKLREQSQYINRFLDKKKKGGQPMAIGGQNVMNPIVKKDNRNWLEYLKN